MFHTSITARAAIPSSVDRRFAFDDGPFPAKLGLCDNLAPATDDCEALRFAAEAARSNAGNAFRPAFATGDWRVFASFCVVRRLPAGHRVLIPGRSDGVLHFVVEGSLWQEAAGAAQAATSQAKVLQPGAIVGEDAVFSDGPCALDVRALEDSLVLELTLPRRKELAASCPEIGFELLRAAGAVIAARNRMSGLRAEVAAN